jgi:hypothetical protein
MVSLRMRDSANAMSSAARVADTVITNAFADAVVKRTNHGIDTGARRI